MNTKSRTDFGVASTRDGAMFVSDIVFLVPHVAPTQKYRRHRSANNGLTAPQVEIKWHTTLRTTYKSQIKICSSINTRISTRRGFLKVKWRALSLSHS